MDTQYTYDPFEGRRGRTFPSKEDIEEFERYWRLKHDQFESDCADQKCVKPELRLWQLKYFIDGERKFIGAATIAAPTPKQAEVIFRNESVFEGFRHLIRITEIQEILIPHAPAMLAENYTGVIDKGFLEKYPFETKKHAAKEIYELKEKVNALYEKLNLTVSDVANTTMSDATSYEDKPYE